MKHILFVTLLTGVSNVFVLGQRPSDLFRLGKDTVIILAPDNMPCVKPSLAMIERMPVKKLDSRRVRPMPNGEQPWGPGLQAVPPVPMPGPKLEMRPPGKKKWQ